MSEWQPPPPPPPAPSFPPGQHKSEGGTLFDAVSQFILVFILLGCQHPQLMVGPLVALWRCVSELAEKVRTCVFDCIYDANGTLGDLLNTPRQNGDEEEGVGARDERRRHRRREYDRLGDEDEAEAGHGGGGERRRRHRAQRSQRADNVVRLPPRGALRSASGPFPGRVVLHHKLSKFQARLDEALRALRPPAEPADASRPAAGMVADGAASGGDSDGAAATASLPSEEQLRLMNVEMGGGTAADAAGAHPEAEPELQGAPTVAEALSEGSAAPDASNVPEGTGAERGADPGGAEVDGSPPPQASGRASPSDGTGRPTVPPQSH